MGISPGPPRSNFRSFLLIVGGGRSRSFHKRCNDDLFEQIISIENLLFAWERFRKGKRSRMNVMIFERYLEDNLFEIQHELESGRYLHSAYERFTIHDPKQRTIHKACVKDRVVHQAIVNIIEPIFERRFIYDSYSCRVNKGTHAAVRRLRTFLRQASHNNTRTIYAVKCDVKKFFDSVSHEILIRCTKTMSLLKDIILSFPALPGMGIPLGNLTSQLFANVYLHKLDWYIKHTLRIHHYVRYCDDFVMLVDSYANALALAEQTDAFLNKILNMQLHPNKVHVRTWRQGVDFLGYIVLPHATILRPQTERRAIAHANTDNVSSYLGLCQHANAYDVERQLKNKTSLNL